MPKLTQPQLQTLLQLRRSQKPLLRLQLQTTIKALKSLVDSEYIELTHDPLIAKITTAGILATNDHIKNYPIELPEERSHLKDFEVFELVSLYYPNESLYLMMVDIKNQNFYPISAGTEHFYSRVKIIEIFEYLRGRNV